MRLLVVICSAAWLAVYVAGMDNISPYTTTSPSWIQKQRRHPHRYSTSITTRTRGGDGSQQEGTSSSRKVSVSADTQLPEDIADACLVAFRAPVPVPTNDDYENDNKNTDKKDVESAEDEDTDGQSSITQIKTKTGGGVSAKLQNLQERLGPAILMLGGVGLWSYYLKEDGLLLLTLALQIGMYKEMTVVIGGPFPHSIFQWWWFLTACVGFNLPKMFPWAGTNIAALTYGMSVLGVLCTIVGYNWKGATEDDFREYLRQAAVSFLSILLVVAPSSFWISTLEEFGMSWIVYSVVLVIINDTMAYFFGILMGKHPLVPVISPKKTWEGFLGAAVSTVLVAMYWLPSLTDGLVTEKDGMVISAFVSLIAPFGGFMASLIKRAYGQKDFGDLFPGHGGLVDRLDCQVIMAPFLYLYLTLSRADNQSISELLTKVADSVHSVG